MTTTTFKSYNELAGMNKQERFFCIFSFVTTQIKNEAIAEIIKSALMGRCDENIKSFAPAFTISELAAKGFIGSKSADCLIDMIRF
jgi:hypothetical protein